MTLRCAAWRAERCQGVLPKSARAPRQESPVGCNEGQARERYNGRTQGQAAHSMVSRHPAAINGVRDIANDGRDRYAANSLS